MTTAQPTTTHNIVELNDVFRQSKSLGQEAWSRLIRNKASVFGMIVIAFFIWNCMPANAFCRRPLTRA